MEIVCTLTRYREFESPPLRQFLRLIQIGSRTAATPPTPSGPKGSSGNGCGRVSGSLRQLVPSSVMRPCPYRTCASAVPDAPALRALPDGAAPMGKSRHTTATSKQDGQRNRERWPSCFGAGWPIDTRVVFYRLRWTCEMLGAAASGQLPGACGMLSQGPRVLFLAEALWFPCVMSN